MVFQLTRVFRQSIATAVQVTLDNKSFEGRRIVPVPQDT